MVLISTGIPYSHTLSERSSEVDMNRRLSSMNSRVLMAPRWWSYSCTVSLPARLSYCTMRLSDKPAKNSCPCSADGLNLMTCGVLPQLKRLTHCPVSVSHNRMRRSNPPDRNRVPSLLNDKSVMALLCPANVRSSPVDRYTSQILTIPSAAPDKPRWLDRGNNCSAVMGCPWYRHVWMSFFGM